MKQTGNSELKINKKIYQVCKPEERKTYQLWIIES